MKRYFTREANMGQVWEWDDETKQGRWFYRDGTLKQVSRLRPDNFSAGAVEVFPVWRHDPLLILPEGL